MKLTLSMIAKNEELMIEKALQSCEGVDEIVILDTGSTDRTIEIGRKYGTVLTHYTWNDNFSEARNECKKHCTGDWLLILDCDEVLDTGVRYIKEMINSKWIKNYDILLFDVKTPVEKNEQPRVFRNDPDIWYYGAAHNLPKRFPEGLEKPGTSVRIPDERAYKTSFHVTAKVSPNHARDPDRTMRILEKAMKEDPMNPRNLYYYVREQLNRNDPIKALFYLDRYFRISPPTNECADAHLIAATCYLDLGDRQRAMDEGWMAVKYLPTFEDAYIFLSEQYSHPAIRAQLLKLASVASNEGVLFRRDFKSRTKK